MPKDVGGKEIYKRIVPLPKYEKENIYRRLNRQIAPKWKNS